VKSVRLIPVSLVMQSSLLELIIGRRKAGLEPLGRDWDKPNGIAKKDIKPKGGNSKGKGKAEENGTALPITPESSESKPKAKKPRVSTATSSRAKSPKDDALKISKPKPKKKKEPVPVVVSGSSPSLSPPPALPSGPKPHDPAKKQRPSHAFSLSESPLTDEEVVGQPPKAGQSSKPKNKKAIKGDTKVTTKKEGGKVKSTTKKADEKQKPAVKDEKGKGKAKQIKPVDKKPRAKPVKKIEVPVEPPVFEKVDTRLGRVEAEHRIMVSSPWETWLIGSYGNTCVVSELYFLSLSDHYRR
jgi:hypothetical protein